MIIQQSVYTSPDESVATLQPTTTVSWGTWFSVSYDEAFCELASAVLTGEGIHVWVPSSLRPDSRFLALKDKWKLDTRVVSDINQKCMHPAYQEIIGMGWEVVSTLLRELESEPDHWFWALSAITGEDPVANGDRGDILEMAQSWLEWGRTRNLI